MENIWNIDAMIPSLLVAVKIRSLFQNNDYSSRPVCYQSGIFALKRPLLPGLHQRAMKQDTVP